ncbi:MAG TPA: alpha/beta fold hydrolase [Pyrinomonadaceae bacterium]|jgi:medium-chain acyl-[acyl-carrier-protein] hydrolase|nr:alpha/beta fold hydrolase [Pyrinomonadaceae bacterium]
MKESANPWLISYGPSPRARLRLFCFPYAGGSAHIFRQWPQRLPDAVEVCAVQPPGRGNRLRERPFTNLLELVAAAGAALRPFMDRPFAFYGHSMGSTVAYELARRLQEEGREGPLHLIVSGCRAPQLAETREITYDLPEPEFVEELRRLNGTPAEVLDHPELLQLILPLLKADFEAIQTYRHGAGPALACPLTAVGGLDDREVTREHLAPWRELTAGAFSLHMVRGDHFFLHTSQAALLEIVARQLAPAIR